MALGSLETEVMEVLWAADRPLTVREARDDLNEGRTAPLAYTTVLTVMSRLADKGALRRAFLPDPWQDDDVSMKTTGSRQNLRWAIGKLTSHDR